MARAPRITINVSEEERKKLRALAQFNERSEAAEARLAIRFYIESQQQTSGRRR